MSSVARAREQRFREPLLISLVAALLQRLVDLVPSSHQRAALQVSAHAQVTTEPVLRAALPSSDAAEVSELWDWLRGPTFMEEAHRNPPA